MIPGDPLPWPEGDELRFRSLAAPGLDEDDLFAALSGLPGGRGALWGDAGSLRLGPPDDAWNEERQRRARHEELLRKWPPAPAGDGDSSRAAEGR